MGNKLTCCLMPTASRKPGRRHCGWTRSNDGSGVYQTGSRNSAAAPPVPTTLEPAEMTLHACEGHQVLHISDLEMFEELTSDLIPSDHPRASTIFLKKSQMDVQENKKKNYSYHVSLSHLTEKYSSCSTIFLDDSTICQPNLGITVQCLALAIYYHIKNRDADRSEDIFDERLHPFTQEMVPEEHFSRDPDPDSIYRFISPFFSATQLRAEYAITTLVYLERLLIYAEIDICPTNWKRIVLGAIILASKYLHDLAIWNADFCSILRSITVEDMNEMERHFLDLLEFRLNISASVYAKYYFDLRSLARDHGLPIVFAPLQKERAQNLEGIENIQNEIEDSTEPLIDPVYGHGSQNLINLLLTGHAVSNVWDGDRECSGMKLLGIHEQAAVGFLTLMEALRYCKISRNHIQRKRTPAIRHSHARRLVDFDPLKPNLCLTSFDIIIRIDGADLHRENFQSPLS